MGRPKTGKPPKKNMVLTVDVQTRERLDLLSQLRQKSISAMVADWAEQDVLKLSQEAERQAINDKYMEALKPIIASGKADKILQSPKAQALESLVPKQNEDFE